MLSSFIILYCTATNIYLNICIIVPNDPSGNRVVSVIDFSVFSLFSVCLFSASCIFSILQHNIRPPWLAQYNIFCHKIISSKYFWCLGCLNNCLDTNNSIRPNLVGLFMAAILEF